MGRESPRRRPSRKERQELIEKAHLIRALTGRRHRLRHARTNEEEITPMTTYAGWWQVPDHLMPATTLGELEYPRTTNGRRPAAWVATRDWSDRKASLPLYDARACPPTR